MCAALLITMTILTFGYALGRVIDHFAKSKENREALASDAALCDRLRNAQYRR